MLQLAIVLLLLALVAGALGFSGMMANFAWAAQLLFYVFLVLFLISAAASAMRGPPRRLH